MFVNFFGICPLCDSDNVEINESDCVGAKEGDYVECVCRDCDNIFYSEVCSVTLEIAGEVRKDDL